MRQPQIEHRPGPPPEIRPAENSIIFEFDETSGEQGAHLVIRCDDRGNVYASVAPCNRAHDEHQH